MKRAVLIAVLILFAFIFIAPHQVSLNYAPVEKTGQTQCWNEDGNPISCSGTGQDGEYQKGVAWPVPRFTDNGDGTVTDNLTGLMWAQNAQEIAGSWSWYDAIWGCEVLELGYDGCNYYSDWRLPNVKELLSLVDYGQYEPALPSGHPFINVRSEYWTSTTRLTISSYEEAYNVNIGTGRPEREYWKSENLSVWPVRGETSGPAPVEKTGQTTSYFSSDDGYYQKGVAWPVPRFTDHGNGTVTDNLTGLMWTKDASILLDPYPWQWACWGVSVWEFGNSGCGLYDDWRVPTVKELLSLVDYGHAEPALPSGHPFINVQSFYWSSTTCAYKPYAAFDLQTRDGVNYNSDKIRPDRYIWPVRRGN